jgi:crotonobetainyl-CoA:carnitine CoA-transferase CaiB-like acyl-CoA transferase
MSGEALATMEESFLEGVHVLELANELGEYCGKLLAGLGADVLKVEPPNGEMTRGYGPFYHDEVGPNTSLHFWHYNLGKRGVTLDLDSPSGQESLARLIRNTDILLDSRPLNYLAERGFSYDSLKAEHPHLVYVRITPFGEDGPWSTYLASDLVHLALGGVMMNCGYTADPSGEYDTPPIAPQMWQSYHVAGELAAIGAIGALNYRLSSGQGQKVSISIHEAVSMNTETDIPDWVYLRQPHFRQTCRHSTYKATPEEIALTKDGRWLLPYYTYLPGLSTFEDTLRLLRRHSMEIDLGDPKYGDPQYRMSVPVAMHIRDVTKSLVGRLKYDADVWRDAQEEKLAWAPLRRPEENLTDEHWAARGTFIDVAHPELSQSVRYVGGKWCADGIAWRAGPRAPLVGEHNELILGDRGSIDARTEIVGLRKPLEHKHSPEGMSSPRGKPFALAGVRIIDLSWLLASGGAGRFFTALGAEVIKVEHETRLDRMRGGAGTVPPGGRQEREVAKGPIATPAVSVSSDPNRSGSFMEINSGKLSLSLDLKKPRGKALLEDLIRGADMVIEGFSPGTMDRLGLGYERLKKINPRIVYVQQSGMGQKGTYGQLRTFGPSAAAFSGLSEMSGLPEPFPPAGIGYSYLDWFGAYNMATAMMAALYRQRTLGKGCYIDASQVETGMYLTGTAILDWVTNERHWNRYGNRSPYKVAAPHGAYPASGADRWIAIACFDQEQWTSLLSVLRRSALQNDPRFETLESRFRNQDDLDQLLSDATRTWDCYELMSALQAANVPAGVCQTAQDRYETDPQLAHLEWMVELPQSDIGRWPVKELPIRYSETPSYIGGMFNRSGPSYGEDSDYVLREILGLTTEDITLLRSEGVVGGTVA